MLPPLAYNPSIIKFENRTLLSYRHHDRKDWRTSLGIADLADGRPINSKPVVPPAELKDNSWEDCRLFNHRNGLWFSATVSQWPAVEFHSVVCYGRLVEEPESWKMAEFFIPNHGRNDFSSLEKNWVFWPFAERLFALYMTHKEEQTWLELDGARVEEVHKSKALPWPYAAIHGGAICPGPDGRLFHWFNSHTPRSASGTERYLVGVAELDALPPFETRRICSAPILSGEEGACLDRNPSYKSNVWFVCGAMKLDGEHWLVSAGRNDSQCCLVKFNLSQLKL